MSRRPGRHRMVCVRVNADELAQLRAVANASGYDSPAAWVRAVARRRFTARLARFSDVVDALARSSYGGQA